MILLLAAASLHASQSLLTEDEAVQLALKRNPDSTAARASESVAAAGTEIAKVLRQPEFRFSRNNLGLDPETLEARTTVGLRWSPPRPRELSLKMAAALAMRDGVRAEIQGVESKLAAEVRLAFRRAAIARERARLAREAANLHQALLETVRRQAEAGIKDMGEADQAELSLADATAAVRRASLQAEMERRKLAGLIDPANPPDVQPAADQTLLKNPAAIIDREEAKARALRLRADVGQLDSICRQAEAAERLARNQRYPWLSFLQVTRRTTELPGAGAWGYQFGIDLPLFRSAAKAEAGVAAAQRARCQLRQQALRAQVAREVDEAASSLEAAAADLIEIDRLYTGPATRALERTRTALENGRADKADLVAAEVRRLDLRHRWLERRMEYALLEAEFETAASVAAR